MKSKQYVEHHLEVASNSIDSLINDIENNRPYVNNEYLQERLEYLKKLVILTLDRVTLEYDENY